jgi:predicted RNase H-like nuclease (RuvC/YqgF family)
MSADKIEQKVSEIYVLARQNPDNVPLQEAVELVKSLRRSRGALQSWNGRYREINSDLSAEITQISQEKSQLELELTHINQEMAQLVLQKERLLAERSRVLAQLREIEVEVEVAAQKVRQTDSLFGKFTILWTLMKSLFLDDGGDFGKIDSRLPPDPDRPQMESDRASINRSLLDR